MDNIGYGDGISGEEDWGFGNIDESKYDTEPEEPISDEDCDGCKI